MVHLSYHLDLLNYLDWNLPNDFLNYLNGHFSNDLLVNLNRDLSNDFLNDLNGYFSYQFPCKPSYNLYGFLYLSDNLFYHLYRVINWNLNQSDALYFYLDRDLNQPGIFYLLLWTLTYPTDLDGNLYQFWPLDNERYLHLHLSLHLDRYLKQFLFYHRRDLDIDQSLYFNYVLNRNLNIFYDLFLHEYLFYSNLCLLLNLLYDVDRYLHYFSSYLCKIVGLIYRITWSLRVESYLVLPFLAVWLLLEGFYLLPILVDLVVDWFASYTFAHVLDSHLSLLFHPIAKDIYGRIAVVCIDSGLSQVIARLCSYQFLLVVFNIAWVNLRLSLKMFRFLYSIFVVFNVNWNRYFDEDLLFYYPCLTLVLKRSVRCNQNLDWNL